MSRYTLTRRGFLAAAGIGIGAGALSACGSSSQGGGGGSTAGGGSVELPNYVPRVLVEPDLQGDGAAIQDGYYSYPYADSVASVEGAVGNGGTVSFLTLTFGAIGTPMDQNQYWQAVNEAVGLTFAVQTTLADSYMQKVQTTIAGGDIPDLVTFGQAFPIPQTPALLEAKFTDLTEYLSGSAIEEYPNLANIPTAAWRGTVFNGGIYGVPCARPTGGAPIVAYTDLFEEAGVSAAPTSLEELREFLREVTDEGRSIWGVPNPFSALGYARYGYGSPNNWREEGGAFTHEYETEEYLAALEWAAAVNADGSMHPDGITVEDGNRLFASMNVATTLGSATGWPGVYSNAMNSEVSVAPWIAPAAEGSTAVLHAGSGIGFFTAFAQTDDPELIKERLRLANYVAAPFGSQEYSLLQYGVEGVHFELVDGNPVTNDLAAEEKGLSFTYLANGPIPQTNYQWPDGVDMAFEFQTQTKDMLIDDPTVGLYSEAALSKTATLSTQATSMINDIVLGRKSVSAWTEEFLPQWRSQGGDEMRSEYEEAFEQA